MVVHGLFIENNDTQLEVQKQDPEQPQNQPEVNNPNTGDDNDDGPLPWMNWDGVEYDPNTDVILENPPNVPNN